MLAKAPILGVLAVFDDDINVSIDTLDHSADATYTHLRDLDLPFLLIHQISAQHLISSYCDTTARAGYTQTLCALCWPARQSGNGRFFFGFSGKKSLIFYIHSEKYACQILDIVEDTVPLCAWELPPNQGILSLPFGCKRRC